MSEGMCSAFGPREIKSASVIMPKTFPLSTTGSPLNPLLYSVSATSTILSPGRAEMTSFVIILDTLIIICFIYTNFNFIQMFWQTISLPPAHQDPHVFNRRLPVTVDVGFGIGD